MREWRKLIVGRVKEHFLNNLWIFVGVVLWKVYAKYGLVLVFCSAFSLVPPVYINRGLVSLSVISETACRLNYRLGEMNLSHSRAKMSLLVQYVFSWYSVWNLRQIQLYRAWKELIVIGSSPSRNCSWTILKLIRKRSKKNNRKCQEITKESLLSRCRNSQNAKVNRCQFTT